MATTHTIHDDSPLPRLAPRAAESNKGTYGRALLVGGARGMTGAIGLAGMACLRAGAGLVELAVARSCQPIVAGYEPSYMTFGLPEDAEGRLSAAALDELRTLAEKATALGCGPGLALTDETTTIALALYASYARAAVFDADALNALARHPEQLGEHAGPRILTPHPGEFGRLTGQSVAAVQAARAELASDFARRHQVIVVLKGHRTCITDGRRIALNTTGNPGMATGGTGDVLTGILTALLGQGLEPYDAARLAAHLHGMAGDLAATELGETSLIASDLVRHLPAAFVEHERRSGT